jgi:hypothetical protein
MSDGELMNQVNNLLAEEERNVQAITALLTFGVFKFIVEPLLEDEKIEMRSANRTSINLLLPLHKINQSLLRNLLRLQQPLQVIFVQSHQTTLGNVNCNCKIHCWTSGF